MSWDIEVREKVYQRLANEIFFRILHGEYGLGTKMPSYTELSWGIWVGDKNALLHRAFKNGRE